MLRDAMRQKYQMIERDPRDEKWAEWHMSRMTFMSIQAKQSEEDIRRWGAFTPPPVPADTQPAPKLDEAKSGAGLLYGYTVRLDDKVPNGKIELVCETDLEASIRHQRELGDRGATINVVKFEPHWAELPPEPEPPTLRGLVKHWRDTGAVKR